MGRREARELFCICDCAQRLATVSLHGTDSSRPLSIVAERCGGNRVACGLWHCKHLRQGPCINPARCRGRMARSVRAEHWRCWPRQSFIRCGPCRVCVCVCHSGGLLVQQQDLREPLEHAAQLRLEPPGRAGPAHPLRQQRDRPGDAQCPGGGWQGRPGKWRATECGCNTGPLAALAHVESNTPVLSPSIHLAIRLPLPCVLHSACRRAPLTRCAGAGLGQGPHGGPGDVLQLQDQRLGGETSWVCQRSVLGAPCQATCVLTSCSKPAPWLKPPPAAHSFLASHPVRGPLPYDLRPN